MLERRNLLKIFLGGWLLSFFPKKVEASQWIDINTLGSGNNSLPLGSIILWSGSIATIPSGFKLCNGQNGTPDLTNKFVLGGGGYWYPIGSEGGNKDSSLVAHNHNGVADYNGDHNHFSGNIYFMKYYGHDSNDCGVYGPANELNYYTGISGGHQHSFTTSISGSSGENANMPPYYSLAYIMKI